MTKTSSRGMFVALATASALILGGRAPDTGSTGGDEPAAELDPRSPEISDLTVAGYPQGPFAPVIAAEEEGLSAEYGISVTLQPAENAPAMLAQIISGDVPIGAVNGFFSVPAALGGADVRVIGEIIRGIPKGQTIEVMPDSGIDSAKDLEGKTVAVVGINSGHHARVAKAVLLDGGDLDQVEFVSLTWAEMVPALEQGTVDAIAVTGNFMFAAQNDLGTKTIIDLGDGPFKEFPDAQWLANGAWVDANPNTVAAFQCAIVLGGAKLVNDDRSIYEDALRSFGYSEEAIAADLKLIHPEANDPVQIIPDLMYELGWIDAEFDMASITVPLPTNC